MRIAFYRSHSFFLLSLSALLAIANMASAQVSVPGCSSIHNLAGGTLWKPSNVHGGRGGSWLLGCQVKNSIWPTNRDPLPILDQNGTQIGKLGLWDPGARPYGRRYYMKVSGGSFTEVNTLRARALRSGSGNMYIQHGSRGCFKVKDARKREGAITPVGGGTGRSCP